MVLYSRVYCTVLGETCAYQSNTCIRTTLNHSLSLTYSSFIPIHTLSYTQASYNQGTCKHLDMGSPFTPLPQTPQTVNRRHNMYTNSIYISPPYRVYLQTKKATFYILSTPSYEDTWTHHYTQDTQNITPGKQQAKHTDEQYITESAW